MRAASHATMATIPAADWDGCAGGEDPLLWHRHLLALETTGVATAATGFVPRPVVLQDDHGRIVAAAPAWLKSHSTAELGVDLGLAMAHERLCGAYYPKLQVEVPMIPFAGPRMLVAPGVDRAAAIAGLAAGLIAEARATGAASVQVAQIADPAEALALQAQGFVIAESNTYLWQAGTETRFADRLARMGSRARTEIRRERRRVAETGLRYLYLRDQALSPELAARFYPLYKDNFDRHGHAPWLPEAYFHEVLRVMPEAIDLGLALEGDRWAGAVFGMVGAGRGQVQYWGLQGASRFLHFELVIYRGIERGLITGLDQLDYAGTGPHKAERGLISSPVWTAFWFRDPAFAPVAAAAAARKTAAARAERQALRARSPLRPLQE